MMSDGHQEQQDDDDEGPIFHIAPPPEQTFPNEEQLEKAIHEWSKEHGYELVRRASKKNSKKEVYKRYYHCSKHGQKINKVSESARKRANRKSNRIGCPMSIACVAVDPTNPHSDWQIRHRKSHHNHPPMEAVKLAGHRRRARLGAVEKAVDSLFAIGTETSAVLKFLQTTHPEGLFTRTDVANMKMKWKKHGTCADRQGDKRAPALTGEVPEQSSSQNVNDDVQDISPVTPSVPQAPNEPSHQLPRTGVRGRPPASTSTQTIEILENLQASTQRPGNVTRLTLQSSSVQVLAQSSCGDGSSYDRVPLMNTEHDWSAFRDAMMEASLKEGTHEVLTGTQPEPSPPLEGAAVAMEDWNEYVRQLAIYKRRSEILLYAFYSKLGPRFRDRVTLLQKPNEVWAALEDMFAPRGSQEAYKAYCDLHHITLSNSTGLKDYINGLQSRYSKFKSMKRGELVIPDETMVFMFLRGLGAEWSGWAETTVATNNIGGFGTGDRLDFKDICKRALAHEAMQQQRVP